MEHRILIVDDDPAILKALRGYLEQAGFSVAEALDGEAALDAVAASRPDLVILDLMLPRRDGLDVTRVIRSSADLLLAETPILMLTARVDDVDKVVGLELGADDYVTKPFNPREVVARVKALLRRSASRERSAGGEAGADGAARRPAGSGRPCPADRLEAGELSLDLDRREARVRGAVVELTRTEFNILEALMRSPGYVLSRDQLLERAMGYAYEGLGRTLDTHVRNLRRKIESDPDNPLYVRTVYGIGYRFMGGGE